MRYHRVDVARGTYFFTVNLAERKRTLLLNYVDVLRTVMKGMKRCDSFHIDATVLGFIVLTQTYNTHPLSAMWTNG